MKKILKKILKGFGYEIISSNPFKDQKRLFVGKEKLVVFDVGAHHGQTALDYNKLFNNCTIYSFEPFRESFDILNENVKSYPNIKIFNNALGNVIGDLDFHVNKSSATNSILPTHQESSKTWGKNLLDTIETIKIKSTTIDDFIGKSGINQIDVLKIDTQGTEYNVIEGAIKAIKQGKIKLIYLEIITLPTYQNQKHLDEMLSFLRLNGYNLYNIYNYSSTPLGMLRQIDAIFLNNKFQFKE
jgi:FkbM family methyltransferase